MNREYPVIFDGKDSDGNRLALRRPSSNIELLNSLLRPNSDVIDLGSHKGDNSYFLAEQGHNVVALEEDVNYIDDGIKVIKGLGGLAVKHLFVEGRVEDPQIYKQFDAVICTHVLQHVKKDDIQASLDSVMNLTKDQGLNLLTVYTGSSRDQERKPNLYLFKPGEILSMYQRKGWEILEAQQVKRPLEYGYNAYGEETYSVHSYDTIIAKKPRRIPSYMGRPLDFWRRTNPDMADMIEDGTLRD